MIAFVQPFGLADGSGGARILRALLEDAPMPFVSICVSPGSSSSRCSEPPFGRQVHISPHPRIPWVGGTRLAPIAYSLLRPFSSYFARRFESRLADTFRAHDVSAVHAIPHGSHFWHAFRVAREMDLPYVLNIHDDLRYNLAGSSSLPALMERLEQVWTEAEGRMVISDAMGEAYCQKFAPRSYEVITDGLTEQSLSAPRNRSDSQLRLYFMGALHLSYHPNFEATVQALESLHASAGSPEVSFILRGSALPVKTPKVPVDQRPYAPEKAIQRDFEDVDVLYFPLPFGEEYDPFTRYSMSTKLVTYLGSGLPILYHGPRYAAAAELLDAYDAAVIVDAQTPEDIRKGLLDAHTRRNELAKNAQQLGRERFWLSDQRERFWNLLRSSAHSTSQVA